MANVTWDSSWEAVPAGSDNPSEGDDKIREFKENVRSRLEKEHDWGVSPGTFSTHGWHKAGSAMAYYDSDPDGNITDRPDGSTALDSDDQGRLAIDTTSNQLQYWNGTAWTDTEVLGGGVTITGGTEDNLVSIDASGNLQDSGVVAGEVSNIIEAASSATIKMKVFELGDWDMDADNTSSTIAHGITDGHDYVRAASCMIRADTGSETYSIEVGGYIEVSDDHFYVARTAGGFFDYNIFDNTSFNRGWVTLWYEEA
jgi:hypothetical protein